MPFSGVFIEIGRNNSIQIVLKTDGVAENLSAITVITLTIGATTYTSDNSAGKRIRWAQSGYETGEVRIALGIAGGTGDTTVPTAGKYINCPLILYDASNTAGIRWGDGLDILVR